MLVFQTLNDFVTSVLMSLQIFIADIDTSEDCQKLAEMNYHVDWGAIKQIIVGVHLTPKTDVLKANSGETSPLSYLLAGLNKVLSFNDNQREMSVVT